MSLSRELPQDRLATTDEQGRRIYLYPAKVSGTYRQMKRKLHAVLLLILLVLPWIKINGHQAILLDIAHRRFSVLGLTFWAHDAPMLFFVFGGAAVLLAFVTAVWGRVWCGWACPQTVFVEAVFREIEGWIEGDWVQRKRLDQSPMNADKLKKKSLKWFFYVIVALIVSHSLLAYFVGTEELRRMILRSPLEHPLSFAFMAAFSGFVLFDFGWFREQFCTLVCPYGRFQSVLMDERSMAVTYDVARGEPRRGVSKDGKQGDCVDCFRCVQVCPMGVDIRRGLQLECIHCTACMDACDDVMVRLKKQRGLIRYSKPHFGARAGIYLSVLSLFAVGLAFAVRSKTSIDVSVVRAVGSPYQEISGLSSGQEIINQFKLSIKNQGFDPVQVMLALPSDAQGKGIHLNLDSAILIGSGESRRLDLMVRFPKSMLQSGKATLPLQVLSQSESKQHPESHMLTQEVPLVGPFH